MAEVSPVRRCGMARLQRCRSAGKSFCPARSGDLSAADVVLNFQHQRDPGRLRGRAEGGLELVDRFAGVADDPRRLCRPTRTDASDCLSLVRAGVLRGLSIEFLCAAREHGATDAGYRAGGVWLRIGVVDELLPIRERL